MTKVTASIIVAFVAMPLFSSASFAEGDYYEGISKQQNEILISHDNTGSVSGVHVAAGDRPAVDNGDYYKGATRPN